MTKSLWIILLTVVVGVGMAFVAGCESDAQSGAGLGALAGAGIGAIAGNQSGRAGEGALIGAAVGGGTGYVVGNEQDKKKTQAEMEGMRQDMNTVTVNITNSNGSVSTVRLRKQGVGYVGPRGEYYNSLPTEDQLRPIYGF
jgi:outer membrane lipoprotein SlyB